MFVEVENFWTFSRSFCEKEQDYDSLIYNRDLLSHRLKEESLTIEEQNNLYMFCYMPEKYIRFIYYYPNLKELLSLFNRAIRLEKQLNKPFLTRYLFYKEFGNQDFSFKVYWYMKYSYLNMSHIHKRYFRHQYRFKNLISFDFLFNSRPPIDSVELITEPTDPIIVQD